ncbi:hypothetical protein [Nocardia asteroides]|uniref:hypothetical protein n=1 Tax=Nocardia asteroides TaxID=1824 RepID=UPI0036630054
MDRKQLEFIPSWAKDGEVREISLQSGPRPMHVLLWGRPFAYEFAWESVDGVPRVVDLRVLSLLPGVPVTQQDLRRIPLQRLASAGAMAMAGGEFDWNRFPRPDARTPRKPGPRGLGDEFYSEIATMARFAAEQHTSVRKFISERHGVTAHAADKWLKECRKRGLLTPGELRRNTRKDPDQ